jgi:hypothetical protein
MTKHSAGVVAASVVVVLSATIAAAPYRVDVQNVPVERVVANLERLAAERPKDVGLRINLACVHAMAYAEKTSTVRFEMGPSDRRSIW